MAQSYSTHSTSEQRTNVGPAHRADQGGGALGGGTVHRLEAIELKEAPLDGPPGGLYMEGIYQGALPLRQLVCYDTELGILVCCEVNI